MLPRQLAASIALACIASIGRVYAEDTQAQLLKQIEDLQKTVRELQERVNLLEEKNPASWIPATADVSPAPTAQSNAAPQQPIRAKAPVSDKTATLRTSWQHISPGMTQAEVGQTLGPPTREMLINGKVVWYYYYAGLGAGSVFFNRDGRTSSSQSPNLGWGS